MADQRNPQGNQPGQKPQGGQAGAGHMGDKPGTGKHSLDQGKVGQDTDGDGKVVKPGQKPGQSHGTGEIKR
jgi:hypothetical protein